MKYFLIGLIFIISFLGIYLYQSFTFNDGKLHIVFCNVGQGDGIFIRTPKGLDIVYDAGPDDSILTCLSKNMPFWDRTIEVAILSHPHADHMAGFVQIFKRYKVLSFNTEKIENDTELYKELMKSVKEEGLEVRSLFAGDSFKTKDGVRFKILAPTNSFITTAAPTGKINEGLELASLVTLLSYGEFDLLLTGDSETNGLKEATSGISNRVEIIQVPHHGSRFGLDQEIAETLRPQTAIISVGKNKYGHPTREVLSILENLDIKIRRTDREGDIHLVL